MAAVLASHSCSCRAGESLNNGRIGDDLSFSGSVRNANCPKIYKNEKNLVKTRKVGRFHVEMQQNDLPKKSGRNGRVIKMVPTSEIRERMSMATSTTEGLNGSARKNVDGVEKNVNGVHLFSGGSLVKKDPAPSLKKSSTPKEFPPPEGPKLLPSSEGFSWANENYNSIQRNIDVWSFIISLRVRVLFDNAKWTYIGGFTEDKQRDRRQKTALWLRKCVLQLGPTFIKLGQLSSTRSDLFPQEFVDELAKLQDRVPAFSPIRAKNLIESELGAPMHVLFKEFDDHPIAAASLGSQGHFA